MRGTLQSDSEELIESLAAMEEQLTTLFLTTQAELVRVAAGHDEVRELVASGAEVSA